MVWYRQVGKIDFSSDFYQDLICLLFTMPQKTCMSFGETSVKLFIKELDRYGGNQMDEYKYIHIVVTDDYLDVMVKLEDKYFDEYLWSVTIDHARINLSTMQME